MRGCVGALLVVALLLAGAGVVGAQGGGGYVSILVCKRDAEKGSVKGPEVAYFERSNEEASLCEGASQPDFCVAVAGVEVGSPCAEALAALRRSKPDSLETEVVQTGRPLLIVAEDVEGEALATLVPARPHTDMVYTLGTEHGEAALVGCDFFTRNNATLTVFDQASGNGNEILTRLEDPSVAPTCAQTLTLFESNGIPLRAKVSVSLGRFPARPDLLVLDEPITPGQASTDRFNGHYFVTTVTHRLD